MKRAMIGLAVLGLFVVGLACAEPQDGDDAMMDAPLNNTMWPAEEVVEHATEDCRFHVKAVAEDGALLGVKAIDSDGDIWSVKACHDTETNDVYLQVTREE